MLVLVANEWNLWSAGNNDPGLNSFLASFDILTHRALSDKCTVKPATRDLQWEIDL